MGQNMFAIIIGLNYDKKGVTKITGGLAWGKYYEVKRTHIGDEEDKTAGQENRGACNCERQEETSGIVHESSDHRADCQTKVEGGVAPSLQKVLYVVGQKEELGGHLDSGTAQYFISLLSGM